MSLEFRIAGPTGRMRNAFTGSFRVVFTDWSNLKDWLNL